MLRALFFQDSILTHNNDFVRKNKERDLSYEIAIELYNDGQVDILNPFLNDDLFDDIEKYEIDWIKFNQNNKREGV